MYWIWKCWNQEFEFARHVMRGISCIEFYHLEKDSTKKNLTSTKLDEQNRIKEDKIGDSRNKS
jgi:hypothetical protein